MKHFLTFLSALSALAVASFAQFAPTPVIYPLNGIQQTYIDPNFHSVPFVIAYPNTGITTLVFDPITSAVDQQHVFQHMQKASSTIGTNPIKVSSVTLPGVVNTGVRTQETRLNQDLAIVTGTTGSTLVTVPFNNATYLETGGHYRFVAKLYVTLGAGGSKIDVGGTCSTSNFVAQYMAVSGSAIIYGGQLTSFLSGPSGSATNTATLITIEGELDVGNGGTFVIQFAQSSANVNPSVIKNGSTLTVVQIP